MMYKVLLADDERIILEGISKMIEWNSVGTSLIGAVQNGADAYRLIVRERPDIVISDIKMPGLGGLELIEKVSRKYPSTRFILLTGFGQFEYAKKAMTYGVRHYLLKPCNESHITESLKSVVSELKKEESAKQVKTDLEMIRPHLEKHVFKELITGEKSDAERYLHFFSESGNMKLVLLSFQEQGGKRCLSDLEQIACDVFKSGIITSIRHKGALVLAVKARMEDEQLKANLERIKRLSRQRLQIEPAAAFSGSGDIGEAAVLYGRVRAELESLVSGGQTSVLVRQMIELIQKEAANPKLSLKWAARTMLYMNPDYLGKVFKQETGERFSSYVTKVRIEKAIAKMKKTNDITIGALAEETGFGDNPKYFSLVFKKYTGCTPSEYRKKEEHLL